MALGIPPKTDNEELNQFLFDITKEFEYNASKATTNPDNGENETGGNGVGYSKPYLQTVYALARYDNTTITRDWTTLPSTATTVFQGIANTSTKDVLSPLSYVNYFWREFTLASGQTVGDVLPYYLLLGGLNLQWKFSATHPTPTAAWKQDDGSVIDLRFAPTGEDGYSTAVIDIHKSFPDGVDPATNSDRPTGKATWDFPTKVLSFAGTDGSNGWSRNIPNETTGYQIWIRFGTFSDRGTAATLEPSGWAGAVKAGSTGENGKNANQIAQVQLWTRGTVDDSTPSAPIVPITYTYAVPGTPAKISPENPSADGGEGSRVWDLDDPGADSGAVLWRTTATAVVEAETPSDIIPTTEWSAPKVYVQDGKQGSTGPKGDKGIAGDPGETTVLLGLYQRSDEANGPAEPYGGTYRWTDNTLLDRPAGWYQSIQKGTSPVWISQAILHTDTPTTSTPILDSWDTPEKVFEKGEDGYSYFDAVVFKRQEATPSQPADDSGEFNFKTNTLTPPSGWSITVPTPVSPQTGATQVWETRGIFSGEGSESIGDTVNWTSPRHYSKDGAEGRSVFYYPVFRRYDSNSAPPKPKDETGSYNFGTNKGVPPTGTDGAKWYDNVPDGTGAAWISSTYASAAGTDGEDTHLYWTEATRYVSDGGQGNPGIPGARSYNTLAYLQQTNTAEPARPVPYIDWNDGNITLNNGWGLTPPTIDANSTTTWWQVRISFIDSSGEAPSPFEGTSSAPVKGVNFDGIVTFSDLATSNDRTVITGANIKTGTLSANAIDANGIKAKNVEVGTIEIEHVNAQPVPKSGTAGMLIVGVDNSTNGTTAGDVIFGNSSKYVSWDEARGSLVIQGRITNLNPNVDIGIAGTWYQQAASVADLSQQWISAGLYRVLLVGGGGGAGRQDTAVNRTGTPSGGGAAGCAWATVLWDGKTALSFGHGAGGLGTYDVNPGRTAAAGGTSTLTMGSSIILQATGGGGGATGAGYGGTSSAPATPPSGNDIYDITIGLVGGAGAAAAKSDTLQAGSGGGVQLLPADGSFVPISNPTTYLAGLNGEFVTWSGNNPPATFDSYGGGVGRTQSGTTHYLPPSGFSIDAMIGGQTTNASANPFEGNSGGPFSGGGSVLAYLTQGNSNRYKGGDGYIGGGGGACDSRGDKAYATGGDGGGGALFWARY